MANPRAAAASEFTSRSGLPTPCEKQNAHRDLLSAVAVGMVVMRAYR
jgi:hypothetical protein